MEKVEIKKVENGFIVTYGATGRIAVFKDFDEVVELIRKEFFIRSMSIYELNLIRSKQNE